jgi:hypothetical protein
MVEERILNTLQKIKNDQSLEVYFFNKLSEATSPLEWLVPLRDAGYFSPEKNPKRSTEPDSKGFYNIENWNAVGALANMAAKATEQRDEESIRIISEIIKGIISYREEGRRIENSRTDVKILRAIANLPIELVEPIHIEFIKESLQAENGLSLFSREIGTLILPKLIKENRADLLLQLLDVILERNQVPSTGESKSILEDYYLKEILDDYKSDISKLCGIDAADIAISKMNVILNANENSFHYIWIPTIEDHEQISFPDRYECQIVQFVRDMLISSPSDEVEKIVGDFISHKHIIFVRLACYLIDKKYDDLSKMFWSLKGNPLNISYTHEVFELIKNNCKKFTDKQIEVVIGWIESQDYSFYEKNPEDHNKTEKIIAYYKKEWLLALLESNNKQVADLYNRYNAINDAEIEHPGFHYWSSGARWVETVSPVDVDEFIQKPTDEIVDYINNYKEEEQKFTKDFVRVSLSSTISSMVSKRPEKFSSEIYAFNNVSLKYKYGILSGLLDAWNNNKSLDWEHLLEFCHEFLIKEAKYITKKNSSDDYYTWILGKIAELIMEGTKNDKHAFPVELLPIAETILLSLFEKSEDHCADNYKDLPTTILNSIKGKTYTAAINYSLRYARTNKKSDEAKWLESMRSFFTEHLQQKYEYDLEFYAVLGWHIPYLYYLDKFWVEQNFDSIFKSSNIKCWEASMVGYLDMNSTVYEQIYSLLSDGGHFERGIAHDFKDDHAREKLVQNIIIGYFAGWDNLDSDQSLIKKLILSRNYELLKKIPYFIWGLRDKVDDKKKTKIKRLWSELYDMVKSDIRSKKAKSLASDLSKWLVFLDEITDEDFNHLMLSAKYINEEWNSSFFIEYLDKHVASNPKKVGQIFLEIINNDVYPDFEREHVVSIVDTLFKKNESKISRIICNSYLKKGYNFLNEVFIKYTKDSKANYNDLN